MTVAAAIEDLGRRSHADPLAGLDFADELGRHRRRQFGATGDDGHFRRMASEVEGSLAARVASAHDHDMRAGELTSVARRRAVEHSGAATSASSDATPNRR